MINKNRNRVLVQDFRFLFLFVGDYILLINNTLLHLVTLSSDQFKHSFITSYAPFSLIPVK